MVTLTVTWLVVVTQEALRDMMGWGERYVQLADAKGELEPLAGLRRQQT